MRGTPKLSENYREVLVPKKGLEPPHPCEYMDLNHARLPIPPLRHGKAASETRSSEASSVYRSSLRVATPAEPPARKPFTTEDTEATENRDLMSFDLRALRGELLLQPAKIRPQIPLDETTLYNLDMTLTQQVQKDMVDAMKKKEELRLSTLRMMKAALKNKEIDKRALLDEKEELQVFSTMIKQRKDSIEAFEKGNRHELAQREAEEIVIIETYMPKSVGEEEIAAAVKATIAEMGAPTMKDMGTVMKNVMAKFEGARVDGKVVSEMVKTQLGASS
jgi:uncharacterized protein